jgi:hypothetical protein
VVLPGDRDPVTRKISPNTPAGVTELFALPRPDAEFEPSRQSRSHHRGVDAGGATRARSPLQLNARTQIPQCSSELACEADNCAERSEGFDGLLRDRIA